MADIHILEGSKLRGNVWVYRVAFHVPVDSPNSAVTFPAFESEVADITAGELSDIQAGTLLEIIKAYRYNTSTPIADYRTMLRQKWNAIYTRANAEYNQKYQFYLLTLARL